MFGSKKVQQSESFSKRSESFQKRHRERSSSKAKRSFKEHAATSSRIEKKTHSSRPSVARYGIVSNIPYVRLRFLVL